MKNLVFILLLNGCTGLQNDTPIQDDIRIGEQETLPIPDSLM